MRFIPYWIIEDIRIRHAAEIQAGLPAANLRHPAVGQMRDAVAAGPDGPRQSAILRNIEIASTRRSNQ
jgi:hypothetical protein